MAAVTSIIAALGALGSLAGGLSSAGVFGGNKSSSAPAPAPAPVPAGPPADLTADALAGQKPSSINEPGFLRFSPGMTSLQKRANFATMATQGSGPGRDPDAMKWYKDAVLSDYDPAKGVAGGILPIERQLATNVFGVQPRNDSAESFLSALLRGSA